MATDEYQVGRAVLSITVSVAASTVAIRSIVIRSARRNGGGRYSRLGRISELQEHQYGDSSPPNPAPARSS